MPLYTDLPEIVSGRLCYGATVMTMSLRASWPQSHDARERNSYQGRRIKYKLSLVVPLPNCPLLFLPAAQQ